MLTWVTTTGPNTYILLFYYFMCGDSSKMVLLEIFYTTHDMTFDRTDCNDQQLQPSVSIMDTRLI